MSGFYIKKLVAKGKDVPDAAISFAKGANLITGASDTGKSYVFSAIAYVLGSTEQPKEINEALNYTDIYLEIETYSDSKLYTLYRKIGKNQIEVKEANSTNFLTANKGHRKLTTTGSANSIDNISHFLLGLCDLQEMKLLYNRKNGVTHNLTFDSLRKLTFVDEERIIKTASPFYYSSQFLNQTKGQSLLSLLMTGQDYSDVVEKEDILAKETKISGKLEYLSFQISQLASDKDGVIEKINNLQLSDTDRYLSLDKELKENLVEAKALTSQKNGIVQQRRESHDRLIYTQDLINRFAILEKQYNTDTERLDFILEASVLSSQLGDTICPVCSSPLDENHYLHLTENVDFRQAAEQELNKNKSKLAGLLATVNTLKAQEEVTKAEIERLDSELETLERNLSANFSPQIQKLKNDLKEFLDVERLTNQIAFIDGQITKLYAEKDRLEKLLNSREKSDEITILSYSLLSELCTKIGSRLTKWNYEQRIQVDFDTNYRVFDIVISGKNRKSYGKGKRSISYAACLFGLLDYCRDNNRNFSNLIVMDSPLTTFEEKKKQVKDTKEILTTEVLKSFFLDFGNLPNNSQVIIFDNKEPDAETLSATNGKIHIEIFTGTDEGRYGFFPVQASLY